MNDDDILNTWEGVHGLLVTEAEIGNVLLLRAVLRGGICNNGLGTAFRGCSPLVTAIENDNLRCAKILLPYSKKPYSKNHHIGRAINCAAMNGHVDCLAMLIEAGVDVYEAYNEGTPLYWASRRGHVDCMRLLLKNGADPNFAVGSSGFEIPLCWANSLECAKLLVEHGADVNAVSDCGTSALSWIWSLDVYGVSKYLLEQGAKTELYDPMSGSALIQATRKKDHDLVALLVSYGADLEATEKYKETPLIQTAIRIDLKSMRILLKHGANVHAKDYEGCTALHRVFDCAHQHSCEDVQTAMLLLLQHNSDPDAAGTEGRTPLSYALEANKPKLTALLLKHGATSTGTAEGQKSAVQVARESKTDAAAVLREHFRISRLRKFRGIVRFFIVSSRYRQAVSKNKHVAVGKEKRARNKPKHPEAGKRAYSLRKRRRKRQLHIKGEKTTLFRKRCQIINDARTSPTIFKK